MNETSKHIDEMIEWAQYLVKAPECNFFMRLQLKLMIWNLQHAKNMLRLANRGKTR